MPYIDIIIDAERAVGLSGLTDHQKLVVELRWRNGMTQEDVAKVIGVTTPAVFQSEKAAKGKIQAVLSRWCTSV